MPQTLVKQLNGNIGRTDLARAHQYAIRKNKILYYTSHERWVVYQGSSTIGEEVDIEQAAVLLAEAGLAIPDSIIEHLDAV